MKTLNKAETNNKILQQFKSELQKAVDETKLNKYERSSGNYKRSNKFNSNTAFCMYSGLPVQQENYFQGKDRLHAVKHWIFDQKPTKVLRYMINAKTKEQKLLTQLAALKLMKCIIINYPVSIPDNVIFTNHNRVTELFIQWESLSPQKQKHLVGGYLKLPIYKVDQLIKNNSFNYEDYLKELEKEFNKIFFDLQAGFLDDSIENLLKQEKVDKQLRDDLLLFREQHGIRYSKKLGNDVLLTLAENDINEDLIRNLKDCRNFLLNDGYRTAENSAVVYTLILESILPIGNDSLQDQIKIVLDYLKIQIDLMLEAEAGFFGKKNFISSTGKIENCADVVLLSEDFDGLLLNEDDLDAFKVSNKPSGKIVLTLKPSKKKLSTNTIKINLTARSR